LDNRNIIFETERLLVRKWDTGDLDGLYDLYADTAISENIPAPLTKAETSQIFHDQLDRYICEPTTGRYFIINKQHNKLIGTFLLRTNEGENGVEMGYALRKVEWGKGFATDIVRRGLDYVFNTTDFTVINAYTELPNYSSKKVLEKCGFTQQANAVDNGEELNLFSLEKFN